MRANRYIFILFLFTLVAAHANVAGWRAGVEEYRYLRGVQPDGDSVIQAENIRIERPGGVIEMQSGLLAFLPEIQGRRLGAIFAGEGKFTFQAPDEAEQQQTARFNRGRRTLETAFTAMAIWFSDSTAQELIRQGKVRPGDVTALARSLGNLRSAVRRRWKHNVEAELLRYAEIPDAAYFCAVMDTRSYGTMAYVFNPGEWEEVALLRLSGESGPDVWNSFSHAGGAKTSKDVFDVKDVRVETVIQKNASLSAAATLTMTARQEGSRWIPLSLAPTLRVRQVSAEEGAALPFIQEDEKEDADLWVLLPAPVPKMASLILTVQYQGKGVIEAAGDGNFMVQQRSRWFPRPVDASDPFADRTHFHLIFRVPREFTLVSVGDLVRREKEGDLEISEWRTSHPLTVAGYSYGRFKATTVSADGWDVEVYDNPGLNNELQSLRSMMEANPRAASAAGLVPGALTTAGMGKAVGAGTLNAARLYAGLFGEIPFRRIRVTQQPAAFFGQSWPGLLFLPYISFLDGTARNMLGLNFSARDFLELVGPHEIAHLWWGHAVVWRDYRDQWMSEGFAEYSAAMYAEALNGQKALTSHLEKLRQWIGSRLPNGGRPADLGPVTLGVRLESSDSPGGYRLVYAKGAYILHMLRMLMRNFNTGEETRFRAMMQDLVRNGANGPVTTRDFLGLASKHMGEDMAWFFQEWVYSGGMPRVEVSYTLRPSEKGVLFSCKSVTTGVGPGFRMPMPLTFVFRKGQVTGRFALKSGTNEFETLLPEMPQKLEFNPLEAVLCDLSVRKN